MDDIVAMHGDLIDAVILNPPYVHDPKIKRYPKELSEMKDLDEEIEKIQIRTERLFKDRRIQDLQYIKHPRSKEMYNWICDVVDEQGGNMNKQLGLAYVIKIRDADDIEVPITMDFTQ